MLYEQTSVTSELPPPLLVRSVDSVFIPPQRGQFIVREMYVEGPPVLLERASIERVSRDFNEVFLGGEGKVENHLGGHWVRHGVLSRQASVPQLIKVLGGEGNVEVQLSTVYAMMVRHEGDDLVLGNKFHNKRFFVRDAAGILRVVGIVWGVTGWVIVTYPINSSGGVELEQTSVFSSNAIHR